MAPARTAPRRATTSRRGDPERLKRYWIAGEGRAKWDHPPHPWTQLYHHLLKYIKNPELAKRTAAEWFHEARGFWPGADVHRVTMGDPPRGKVVGPG